MTVLAQVAVLPTRPEAGLEAFEPLFELAQGAEALDPHTTAVLKDKFSTQRGQLLLRCRRRWHLAAGYEVP